jgi:hypothetical protein
MQSQKTMIKADPVYRRRMSIVLAMLILFGVVIIAHANSYFKEILQLAQESPEEAIMALKGYLRLFMVANLIFFLPFFIYFFSLGIRTLKSREFPPPGAKVLRDTYLLTGKLAYINGVILILFSLVVLAFALVVPVLIQNVLSTLL